VSNLRVDLTGTVIAVTGASGALGAAVAQALAGFGARVAQIDHGPAPAGVSGGELVFGGTDLSDAEAAVAVMGRIVAATGRLDGLINIAGGFRFEKLEGGSLETWDAMYRVNLRTCVAACSAAVPHLLRSRRARIINIGAMGAAEAAAGMGAYAAWKAGVAKLTESLAEELKDRGVTVNALLPSTIDTARNRLDMPTAQFDRWVQPAALADVIAFLLSDAADAVTGALIPVTGRV
jgi:NAD(P)-dependent dehydrogenase (short-subunit alcohol dehydrogenase family)